MLEIVILCGLAAGAIALACHKPSALFILLIVAGPYYGFTKQMLDPESLLMAWKDVLLAALLAGIFLRLHGRLKCPVPLTLLLLYCGVSACIPGDWQIGLLGFRATCQWMLLALAASSLRDPSLIGKVARALVWSGTGAAAVYIVERLFFHTQDQIAASMGIHAEDRWRYNTVLHRFSIVYGNPNALAVFLIVCACFAFAWYFSEKAGSSRALALCCGGICVTGVLFTASRGGFAALIMASIVMGRAASKKLRRLLMAAALACTVFLARPELLTQRLQETSADAFLNSYRYQVWTSTLERAVSSPQYLLVGSGLGTYGGYVSDSSGISDVITENQFLKILGEQGALGLLLMLALVWRFTARGAETGSDAAPAVPAAIAAVLTYCLFGNILDGLIVAVPFWTIAGIRLSQMRYRSATVTGRWPARERVPVLQLAGKA